MEIHLSEKQIQAGKIIVYGAMIFFVFRFLLPILLPFLFAILLAFPVRPMARWLHKRTGIPIGAGAALILTAVFLSAGTGLFFLGQAAWRQLTALWEILPGVWSRCCQTVYEGCSQMEKTWHLPPGTLISQLDEMTEAAASLWEEQMGRAAGMVLDHSWKGVRLLFQGMVTILIVWTGAWFSVIQWEIMKKRRESSLFRREIQQVMSVLQQVFGAYGKTQLGIFFAVFAICSLGLALMGNHYFLLAGLGLGLIDALPFFGAGTILCPWAIYWLATGRGKLALGYFCLYLLCAIFRQWAEARWMGDHMGVTPLENLIATYVGWQLFGFLGLFYGPIAYLLLKELVSRKPKSF